ncbi:hypothetical protein CMV_015668 [Castanea mollissima]|uniref:Uncharacterized protein n=1 Tax=Castanea mollissima TaxID=60419 RepID=A0A8J4QV68_9ROSI|nr:hypothetical protein CMV_015668 [Castanea mollissima]
MSELLVLKCSFRTVQASRGQNEQVFGSRETIIIKANRLIYMQFSLGIFSAIGKQTNTSPKVASCTSHHVAKEVVL